MPSDREQWTCPKCGLTMHPRKCKGHSKRDGKHCGDWAEQGADVCRRHGARAPQVKAKAQQRLGREKAEKQLARLGITPRAVEATEALVEELAFGCGAVDLLAGLVEEEGRDGLTQFGIAGRTESVFWSMLVEARKMKLAAAKACIAAGIAERQVQLAEAQGRVLAEVVRTIVTGLGRDLQDPEVRAVVEPALRLVRPAA